MLKKINRLFSSKYIQIPSQLLLGGIFIYASLGKVFAPEAFTNAIANYKILPVGMAKIVALVLPWFELVFGLALVLNIKPRFSALILSGFLLIFILAIGINLIRGLNVNCGCFIQKLYEPTIGFFHMWMAILRDILFLVPGILIVFYMDKNRFSIRT